MSRESIREIEERDMVAQVCIGCFISSIRFFGEATGRRVGPCCLFFNSKYSVSFLGNIRTTNFGKIEKQLVSAGTVLKRPYKPPCRELS